MSLQVRWDRLITLYMANPLMGLIGERPHRVPILMYHSISQAREERGHPYYQITTSPTVFREHMGFLHEEGYRVVTLNEAVRFLSDPTAGELRAGPTGNTRRVVITFDDGFRDFATTAAPILEQYGFTATVFLATGHVTDKGTAFMGKECLRWSEIKALHGEGFTFGSHTVSHRHLGTLHGRELEWELIASKQTIEDRLGVSVSSFSYPYAFPEHDKKFIAILKDTLENCRYTNGVTTRIGTAGSCDSPLFLKRVPMSSNDDLQLFAAKLRGAYDWLHRPQVIHKKSKSLLLRSRAL